ncbi:MAG: type IIL restriction-modification enzyme MmeI [Limisphaerales bacterium]
MLFPFLIGRELVSNFESQPERYVIDFAPRDIFEAKRFPELFSIIEKIVLPARVKAAKEEEKRNAEALEVNPKAKVNLHHKNFLNKWWQLGYSRQEMLTQIRRIPRYIACSGVTKRQIFEFISSSIHPNDKLQVMALADDYSFGIISSSAHWLWFINKCTTLEERFSYNTESVFDTFPWPQSPKQKEIRAVAEAALALRTLRHEIMQDNGWSLRELYKSLETPGENRLRDAHAALDTTVRTAYGMKPDEDILAFLLKLNLELAAKEADGKTITPPGLPASVEKPKDFVSKDCVRVVDVS